jgi:predicted dehydrogenase
VRDFAYPPSYWAPSTRCRGIRWTVGSAYGYEAEDRHFVRAFLGKEEPRLTFDDGLEVVRMLMAAYQSAEQGKTLEFPPKGLDKFVPAVAQGTWKP